MKQPTVDDLRRLKQRIDDAKNAKARLEGELRALYKQMAEEFGTDKPAELQKKAEALGIQAALLRKQISDGMEALEKEMGE